MVRRGSSAEDSLVELWQTYNQELISAVPPDARVITHYSAYFCDPQQELRRILAFLGIAVSDATIEHACATVSDALRHHQLGTEELMEVGLPDEVVNQYLAMCAEAGPVFKQTQARLPQRGNVRQRDYRDILRLIWFETQIEKKVVDSEEEIITLRQRLNEKQAELDKITNTLGWRLLSHYGRFKHKFLLPAYRLIRPGRPSNDSK